MEECFLKTFMKTYVVDTHWKCLTEALLMSLHNMFSWRNKKENISNFQLKYLISGSLIKFIHLY